MIEKILFNKAFEREEYEMLILVQAPARGASCKGNMLIPSVYFFASLDLRSGQLSNEKGCLEWIIRKNRKDNWKNDFKKFGIYRVKVRKAIPEKTMPFQNQSTNNRYKLVKLLEEDISNKEMEELKEYYSKPISIVNDLGTFTLDRENSQFEGIVNWNGINANVYLLTDKENGDTAENAMKLLEEICDNIIENDEKYRKHAAEKYTKLANDWIDENDKYYDENNDNAITEKIFMNRIKIAEITISPDGSINLFYDDDDMFAGHVIAIFIDKNGNYSYDLWG